MNKLRGVSSKTPKRSNKISRNYSASRDRQKLNKTQNIQFKNILSQITNITQRVKGLCNSSQATKRHRKQPVVNEFSIEPVFPSQSQITRINEEDMPSQFSQNRSHKCHSVSEQCNELRSNNRKLIKQKQDLERRLFYECSERKMITEALYKERINVMKFINQSQGQNKKDGFSDIMKEIKLIKLTENDNSSQLSRITAKKQSPLKQKSKNYENIKPVSGMHQKKQTASSRIQSSLLSSNNQPMTQKDRIKRDLTFTSCNLEKQFDQLLSMSKSEKNKDRKNILRKKMQEVALQIKSMKI